MNDEIKRIGKVYNAQNEEVGYFSSWRYFSEFLYNQLVIYAYEGRISELPYVDWQKHDIEGVIMYEYFVTSLQNECVDFPYTQVILEVEEENMPDDLDPSIDYIPDSFVDDNDLLGIHEVFYG